MRTFRATKRFWKSFDSLTNSQRKKSRKIFTEIFCKDPYDQRLGAHKIEKLSAYAKHKIMAICVEENLRTLFREDEIDGKIIITTLDIGDHRIYR